MEQKTEESLSFLDECTVVCLGYISTKGNVDVDANTSIDDESYRSLCFVVEQELQEFAKKGDLDNIMKNATFLAKQYHESEESLRKTKKLLRRFDSSLDEETFDSCLKEIIQLPVESWNTMACILQFLYKACAYLGNDKMGSVIDVGVRYMRKTTMDFVKKEGGWSSLIRKKDVGDDISSSMVVVSREGISQSETGSTVHKSDAGDASPNEGDTTAQSISNEEAERVVFISPSHPPAPISPLNTPPYSFPSSVTTDDERDSLATPPELVERPQMTESYLQAMGEDGVPRMSPGNDFEFINSENGGSEGAASQKLDDVQAFDPPTHHDNLPSVSTPLTEEPPTAAARKKDEDTVFGRYLPHISLGVAVAAAAAGLFVLKKNM